MEIIGYIILGLSILITLGFSIQVREKAKNEQSTEKAIELQGFLMTASIILIFLIHLSPFHLLWMIPTSLILGLLSMNTPLKILWVFSSIYFSFWYIGIDNLGRKYYVSGEYDKAIESFKEQINKNPSSEELYFQLGLAYGKTGQHEKEIVAYEEGIKLNPKKPELHFNVGIVYNDIGKKQQALNSLREAIRLKPNYLKAHYTICKIYVETGNYENATTEIEIVKKINNNLAEELTLFYTESTLALIKQYGENRTTNR